MRKCNPLRELIVISDPTSHRYVGHFFPYVMTLYIDFHIFIFIFILFTFLSTLFRPYSYSVYLFYILGS